MGNLVDYEESFFKDLLDPDHTREYLKAALEDGDFEVLLLAVRDVALAHDLLKPTPQGPGKGVENV